MNGRQLLKFLLDKHDLNVYALVKDKLHQPTLQSGIQRYLSGKTKEPRRETMAPIAEFFNIPIEAFYDNKVAASVALKQGQPYDASSKLNETCIDYWDKEDASTYGTVDIMEYEVRLQAGNGCIPSYDETSNARPVRYALEWLNRHDINYKKAMRFKVRGTSMEPLLFSGDSVLVNLVETDIIDGKVYALCTPDGLRIKRIYKKLDGGLILHSDNPEYRPQDEEIAADLVADKIHIIGRVRDKSGTGGL